MVVVVVVVVVAVMVVVRLEDFDVVWEINEMKC